MYCTPLLSTSSTSSTSSTTPRHFFRLSSFFRLNWWLTFLVPLCISLLIPLPALGGINPVSMGEATALVEKHPGDLGTTAYLCLMQLLQSAETRVVGIGGDMCLFRLASEVAGLLRSPLVAPSVLSPQAESPQLTPQAWQGIERNC